MRKTLLNKLEDNAFRWKVFFVAFGLILFIHTQGQTATEVYNYLVKIDCKHPDIVTKQAVLETGHFRSYSCRERKNLFGLWNHAKQKFYVFDTWQESCDAYLRMIQYKYKGGDYYEFLKDLGYATDPLYTDKLTKINIF